MQPQETITLEDSSRIRQGVRLWARKQVIGMILLFVMLFSSAGRLDWARGWLFFALSAGFALAYATVLMHKSPSLLAERSRLPKDAKRWDIWLTSVAVIWMPIAAWVVAGLDFRWDWTKPYPVWLVTASVVVWILAYALVAWAMFSNPFFSAVVRIQKDRGHRVISGGPYRYLRHPGYLGIVPGTLMAPVVLNSSWAMIPSIVTVVLIIIRTWLEDRMLQAELEGYREYASRVRYRLVPGIW